MKKILISLAAVLLCVAQGVACTNFLVGKKASADGSVFISYSADSYGNGRTGTLAALCEAMVAYSDSALAYFN